jgi:UPF0176 protein
MTAVATFYRFVRIDDPEALQAVLRSRCEDLALKGTILLAPEGINGTLAGDAAALRAFGATLQHDRRFAGLAFRYSHAERHNAVFYRLKVKVKREIVALGHPEVDPGRCTGTHVDATAWNRLLDAPDVVVIDTRNRYEIGVGTFPGAIDPGTRSFRQFPEWVAQTLDPARHRRVAMFCTGGIRCEKASAWMLAQGFETVYQLDGGVLTYLETTPENRWEGQCFVFDQRVSVAPGLDQGNYVQCHACRRPVSAQDRLSALYEEDLCCPHCHDTVTPAQRRAFAERRRQVQLAAARGARHVGAVMRRPSSAS